MESVGTRRILEAVIFNSSSFVLRLRRVANCRHVPCGYVENDFVSFEPHFCLRERSFDARMEKT